MAKFSKETTIALLACMRLGSTRTAACASAGIIPLTLRNWLGAAEAGDARYQKFAADFLKTEADFERTLVASIIKAGQQDWKAHAWILERKNKADWSMRTELQHDVAGNLGDIFTLAFGNKEGGEGSSD